MEISCVVTMTRMMCTLQTCVWEKREYSKGATLIQKTSSVLTDSLVIWVFNTCGVVNTSRLHVDHCRTWPSCVSSGSRESKSVKLPGKKKPRLHWKRVISGVIDLLLYYVRSPQTQFPSTVKPLLLMSAAKYIKMQVTIATVLMLQT